MIGALKLNSNNVQSCLGMSACCFTTSLNMAHQNRYSTWNFVLWFLLSTSFIAKVLNHCLCSNLVLFLLKSIGRFSSVERWHPARSLCRGELQICLWVDATVSFPPNPRQAFIVPGTQDSRSAFMMHMC